MQGGGGHVHRDMTPMIRCHPLTGMGRHVRKVTNQNHHHPQVQQVLRVLFFFLRRLSVEPMWSVPVLNTLLPPRGGVSDGSVASPRADDRRTGPGQEYPPLGPQVDRRWPGPGRRWSQSSTTRHGEPPPRAVSLSPGRRGATAPRQALKKDDEKEEEQRTKETLMSRRLWSLTRCWARPSSAGRRNRTAGRRSSRSCRTASTQTVPLSSKRRREGRGRRGGAGGGGHGGGGACSPALHDVSTILSSPGRL